MDIESLIESTWEASGYIVKDAPTKFFGDRTIVLYGVSREDIIKQAEHLIKIDRLTTHSCKSDGARLQVTRVEKLNLTSINKGYYTKEVQEDDIYVGDLSDEQIKHLKGLFL